MMCGCCMQRNQRKCVRTDCIRCIWRNSFWTAFELLVSVSQFIESIFPFCIFVFLLPLHTHILRFPTVSIAQHDLWAVSFHGIGCCNRLDWWSQCARDVKPGISLRWNFVCVAWAVADKCFHHLPGIQVENSDLPLMCSSENVVAECFNDCKPIGAALVSHFNGIVCILWNKMPIFQWTFCNIPAHRIVYFAWLQRCSETKILFFFLEKKNIFVITATSLNLVDVCCIF